MTIFSENPHVFWGAECAGVTMEKNFALSLGFIHVETSTSREYTLWGL